jgi:hypothetical protein
MAREFGQRLRMGDGTGGNWMRPPSVNVLISGGEQIVGHLIKAL